MKIENVVSCLIYHTRRKQRRRVCGGDRNKEKNESCGNWQQQLTNTQHYNVSLMNSIDTYGFNE